MRSGVLRKIDHDVRDSADSDRSPAPVDLKAEKMIRGSVLTWESEAWWKFHGNGD